MSRKRQSALEIHTHRLDGLTRDELVEWETVRSRFELQSEWNKTQPAIFSIEPVMEIGTSSVAETAQRGAEHWAHWNLKIDAERTRQFFGLKAIDRDLANAIHSSVFDLWEMSRDISWIKASLPFLAAFIYAHPAFKNFIGAHVDHTNVDPMRSDDDAHG